MEDIGLEAALHFAVCSLQTYYVQCIFGIWGGGEGRRTPGYSQCLQEIPVLRLLHTLQVLRGTSGSSMVLCGTLWWSGNSTHSEYSRVLRILRGTPWYSAYSAVLQALRGSPPYSVVLHGLPGAPGTREYSASSAYSGLSRVLHVLHGLCALHSTPHNPR